ncbi:hypothetical protein MRX96_047210 [Rhipicephalus microplus]
MGIRFSTLVRRLLTFPQLRSLTDRQKAGDIAVALAAPKIERRMPRATAMPPWGLPVLLIPPCLQPKLRARCSAPREIRERSRVRAPRGAAAAL